MKPILNFLFLWALASSLASAQTPVNYQHHTYAYESGRYVTDDLRPITGGVFVDSIRYGWVLLSPAAAEKYGYGEKYVTPPAGTLGIQYVGNPAGMRPVERTDGAQESRTAGGLILFSFNFEVKIFLKLCLPPRAQRA